MMYYLPAPTKPHNGIVNESQISRPLPDTMRSGLMEDALSLRLYLVVGNRGRHRTVYRAMPYHRVHPKESTVVLQAGHNQGKGGSRGVEECDNTGTGPPQLLRQRNKEGL